MPKSSTRKKSPEQIIAAARRAEQTVTVCLRADLASQIAAFEEELVEMGKARDGQTRSLGDPAYTPEEVALAQQIADLSVEADENSIDLVIRALPRNEWRKAEADHPATDEQRDLGWLTDLEGIAVDVYPQSVVSPELSEDVLQDMAESLSEGQWRKIRDAIWNVNGGDGSVPFSRRASLIHRLSSSEDESPAPTGSVSDSSTAGSPGRGRRSPSGSTDSPQPG